MKYIVLVMIVIFYSGCSSKEKYTFYSTKTVDFCSYIKKREIHNDNLHIKKYFNNIEVVHHKFYYSQYISSYEHMIKLLEEEDALFYSSSMTPKRKHFRNKISPWIRQQSYLWRYDDRK